MLLYALTILVSAFLLFQVQPVIAKIILPWFGGSAAVWTTCLLFFQMVLLLGYLYCPRGDPLSQAARADDRASRPAGGQPRWCCRSTPARRGSPSGGDDPTCGILGLAGGHRRAAVFPALHHRSAAAGLVRAPLPGRHALPALRALQCRLHVRAAQLSGAVRTGLHHAPAGRHVDLAAIGVFIVALRASRPTSRTSPRPAAEAAGGRTRRGRPGPWSRPRQDLPAVAAAARRGLACCCWPSPIIFRRTWRPFRSSGCCR